MSKLPEIGNNYKEKSTGHIIMFLMYRSGGFSAWNLNKESKVNDKGKNIPEYFNLPNVHDFFDYFEELPNVHDFWSEFEELPHQLPKIKLATNEEKEAGRMPQKLPEIGKRYKTKNCNDNIKLKVINGETVVGGITENKNHILPFVSFETYYINNNDGIILDQDEIRLDCFWEHFEELPHQLPTINKNKVYEALGELKEAIEKDCWSVGEVNAHFDVLKEKGKNLVNTLETQIKSENLK
jgi:hypothetical protein